MQMLSGNVTTTMVGPTLEITALAPADFSNNTVQIWQGGTPGQFFVVGDATTQIDHTLAVPVQRTGVTNIIVALGPGSDSFQFLAQGNSTSPGAIGGTRSQLAGALTIVNDSSDSNTLQDVQIGGALTVEKVTVNAANVPTTGLNTLNIGDCIVSGAVKVDNSAAGTVNGDSNTTIQGSQLRNSLTISNGAGANITEIDGSTIANDTGGPTVITNGFGGNRVRFSTNSGFPSAVTGTGTTLYGSLTISDDSGYIGVGITDAAIFTGTDVKGPVTITGADSDSSTVMGNPLPGSTLGSDVTVGGPVTVSHGAGFDSFDMESSSAQWGLSITDYTAITDRYGSSTKIVNSQISTISPPAAGTGLTILGDDGPNNVVITDTKVGGLAYLHLGDELPGDADNTVAISTDATPNVQRTSFGSLEIHMGGGDDHVNLSKTDVALTTLIDLYGGQDTVNIDYQQTGTAAAPLSRLVGPVAINGGAPGLPFPGTETDLLQYAPGVTMGSLTTTSIIVMVG